VCGGGGGGWKDPHLGDPVDVWEGVRQSRCHHCLRSEEGSVYCLHYNVTDVSVHTGMCSYVIGKEIPCLPFFTVLLGVGSLLTGIFLTVLKTGCIERAWLVT
jgi:hypothetical protein